MADALISVVVEQLASYVLEEVNLVVGVREDVRDLIATLKQLQGVIADAQKKQIKSDAVKIWLQGLREVVYAADDVLDEWHTKTAISRVHQQRVAGVDSNDNDVASGSNKKVLSFLLPFCHCFKHHVAQAQMRYDISHRMKDISLNLDKIKKTRLELGLFVSEDQNHDEPTYPTQQTSSIINASEIFGRHNDLKKIKDMLVGESSGQGIGPVHVISIVAMGGLGKTSLAGLVYNEESVGKTFEKRIWVCVSEPFDISKIAKDVIEQVEGNKVNIPNGWEALHQQLSKSLEQKRFLIVFDNVWTEDEALWKPLKLSLDGGASGSWVIVTTRSDEVATVVGSTHKHPLGKLSPEESWSLFSHVALTGIKEEEVKKFKQIGQQITKKCDGSPLAIKVLGSFLHQKRIPDWRDVADSDLWELHGVQNKLFPSLFMSFRVLPSISKQCFLYCAMFPKDTVVEKKVLVQLWMAQGFFGTDGTKELEKIGENHFNNLAMRSFFQDFEKDSDGNIKRCKIHDVVHDFAQLLTQGEYCSTEDFNGKEFNVNKVRHLYVVEKPMGSLDGNLVYPNYYEANNLRTLIIGRREINTESFDRLSYLRALDLRDNYGLESLPNGVDKLLHLRYLSLSYTRIRELPETICNLYNLQTLDLNSCYELCKLPERIGDMSNLRHLNTEGTFRLSSLPQGIKRLRFLQTLSKFIIDGSNEGNTIRDLQLFKNLHGSLELFGLHKVRDANEAAQAELNKKWSITAYSFYFEPLENKNDVDARKVMVDVLQKLEPHEDLKKLRIKRYPGYQFPNWMQCGSLLENIVDMELEGCANCTTLPALGNLASLEALRINGMNSVKVIGNEFYGFTEGTNSSPPMIAFPKLKKLEIGSMVNLEEWELPVLKSRKIMPRLSELTLVSANELRSLPSLGRLESLESLSLQSLQCVGPEFLGISPDDVDDGRFVLFPKLKILDIAGLQRVEQWVTTPLPHLRHLIIKDCPKLRVLPDISLFESLESLEINSLDEWEGQLEKEEDVATNKKDGGGSFSSNIFNSLEINYCHKLKVVPRSLFPPTLRRLWIHDCPGLSGKQPCLPLLLEGLGIWRDAGIFSKSLPLDDESGGHQHIISLHISGSQHSSPPEGFNQLKSLEILRLSGCEFLDFELAELQQLTKLQELRISNCRHLKERFQGEEWRSIICHVPNIILDGNRLK